jgi:hypothetical protein
MRRMLAATCAVWAIALTSYAWESPVMLSLDDDESSRLSSMCVPIAAADGKVHVVWSDYRHGSQFHSEVYYRGSGNQGRDWGPEVRLTDNGDKSSYASVAADGDYVHVAYRRSDLGRPLYKRSIDGGANWENERPLHSGMGNQYDHPFIAAGGGEAHLLWGNDSTIYYSKSEDAGATWSDARTLVSGIEKIAGGCKRIAISGETVFIMFIVDQRVKYLYSHDGGETWSDALMLENNLQQAEAHTSAFDIAIEGNRLCVAAKSGGAWISPGDAYVYVSEDNGRTFGAPMKVSTVSGVFATPSVALDGGKVHVAWYEHFGLKGTRYRTFAF